MDNTALRQLASDIVAHLGDPWQVVPPTGDTGFDRVPHIRRGTDGPEFWLHGSWSSSKGRIYVGANYPKDAQGREARPYFSQYSDNGTESPSITFSDQKNGAQAAKDIARRFLPAFIPLWDKMAAQVYATNQHNRDRELLAHNVVAIIGGKVQKCEDGSSTVRLDYDGRFSDVNLDATQQRVSITLKGLTLTQLREVHALLNQ